ncbi:MAG: hypothetical protein KDK28_00970 [Maritimibacter sp.]|nr:hypothetical protein [Maritimibacter sp.]
MSDLGHINHLRAQAEEVRILVAQAEGAGDVVAEMNFKTRLEAIEIELSELEEIDANVGEVALLFDGAPVRGKSSIDAQFAAKSIALFQDLITRLFASGSKSGLTASRGKISGSELAALQLTGLAHGSFGFVLEEKDAAQSSVVRTQVREALEQAAEVFSELTQEDEDSFLIEVDEINPRVFNSLTKFFKHLDNSGATLKTAFPDRTLEFEREKISRGYRRLSESKMNINEEWWKGQLVGLSPIKRTFDFKKEGTTEIKSGRFGAQISQDYLERIERDDGVRLGASFRARIEVATLRKPDGTISVTYTANDLEEQA